MTKIIFINRFFYPDTSATSQLLSDLAFYLAKKDLEICVICSRQSYSKGKEYALKFEKFKGVNIYRIKATHFGRNWLPGKFIDYFTYYIGMCIRLIFMLKRGDLVICKTDPPLSSILTLPISRFRKARHINWVQDLFPEVAIALNVRGIPLPLSKVLLTARNWTFNQSLFTVVIGNVMKDQLIKEGLNATKIHVVHNWSDGKNIWPIVRDENYLRQQWKLEQKFVVGYSGNMGRVHEFDTILLAAKTLQHKNNIEFIFIGDGPRKAYIENWVKRHNLNNIRFFPYQAYDKLRYSLGVPDVHLISLNPPIEGFCVPSKFYGILAAGRPLIFIGDESGELTTPIRESGCGFCIAKGDYVKLASKILLLDGSPELNHSLGIRARNMFDSKYDKSITLKNWLDVIENALIEQIFQQ